MLFFYWDGIILRNMYADKQIGFVFKTGSKTLVKYRIYFKVHLLFFHILHWNLVMNVWTKGPQGPEW